MPSARNHACKAWRLSGPKGSGFLPAGGQLIRTLVPDRHHRRLFMHINPRTVKDFDWHSASLSGRFLSSRARALKDSVPRAWQARNNVRCPGRSRSNC